MTRKISRRETRLRNSLANPEKTKFIRQSSGVFHLKD